MTRPLSFLDQRRELGYLLAAVVVAVVVGAASTADREPDAALDTAASESTLSPTTDTTADPLAAAADALGLETAAESDEEVDSPLADPSQTRGVDGSVGEGTAAPAPEPELEATDGIGNTAVPGPVGQAFGLRGPVDEGDTPDPQIVWTGTEYAVFSTNSGGHDVPVRTSGDLANWSEPRDAVTKLPAWAKPHLTWAPAAAKVGDRWVLYAAILHKDSGVHCIGAFTSGNATGPYEPVATPVRCHGRGLIDPFVFTDDGVPYLYWKAVGGRERQIFGVKLSADGLTVDGVPVHLATATAPWEGGAVENPAMIRTGSGYLLFYSANWWTGSRYATGYAVCDGPLGMCSKATTSSPWLETTSGVPGPGGASFALGPDGRVWMAYHAWTPRIGYGRGGWRRLHVEPVLLGEARPRLDNRAPIGSLEPLVRWPGGMLATGWVVDPDHTEATLARITVDGRVVSETIAGFTSATAWETFERGGPFHGLLTAVPIPAGNHRVCLIAVDDRERLNAEVGCQRVTIDPTPYGEVQQFVRNPNDTVTIRGWVIDPQTDGPASILTTVGDKTGRVIANLPSPGLGERFFGYGDDHGFEMTMALPDGTHQLCVNGLAPDVPPSPFWCQQVKVVPPTTSSSTTTSTTRPTSSTTSTTRPTTTTTRPTTTTSTTSSTTSTTSSTTSTTTLLDPPLG